MQKFTLILTLAFLCSFISGKSRLSPSHNKPAAKYILTENDLTAKNFEDSVRQLYERMELNSHSLDYNVFRLGMIGYYNLRSEGRLNDKNLLTIIDFTKAST